MAEGYSWRELRGEGPSRLPGPDRLGWWVGVSLLVAIILHILAFFALGKVKVALGFTDAQEFRTAPINLERVEILPPEMDLIEPEPVPEQPDDAASLLDEIDVLAQLPENLELEMTPDTIEAEFAIQPQQPLAEGSAEALDFDTAMDFSFDTDLPEMGRTEDPLPSAAEGQVIVDPGAIDVDDPELDAFTEEILRRGAEGDAAEGSLDGMVTLDDLVGLPENVLVGKKTMLPSDLLYEYDSADLRESARVGLMKLALLVERNPELYCWIEGHTDSFGTEEYNLNLARRRAESVKSYLVGSLRLDDDKIITRGYGEARPIVTGGAVEEQAPNRRVEIKMRRERPPEDEPVPEKPVVVPAPEPEVSEAVLVKPMRELPVVPRIEEKPEAPRAVPVEEDVPRAVPVEDEVLRAVPVEEDPPRARPVEE